MSKLNEMLASLAQRKVQNANGQEADALFKQVDNQGNPDEPTSGLDQAPQEPIDPAAAELTATVNQSPSPASADEPDGKSDDAAQDGEGDGTPTEPSGEPDTGDGGSDPDPIDLTDDGDEGDDGDGEDPEGGDAGGDDPENQPATQDATEPPAGDDPSAGEGQSSSEGSDENPSGEDGSEGNQDGQGASQDGEGDESGEGASQDDDQNDETFDEEGQLVSVAEVKEAEANSDKITQASEIIKEAGEISDRLKDLAREIIDRNQGFDDSSPEASVESFTRIAEFSLEALEAQASRLFDDGYSLKENVTPERKAISEAFTTVSKSLTNASRMAAQVLDSGFAEDVNQLRASMQDDYINPTVKLLPEEVECIHIDGAVSLDALRVGGTLLKAADETGHWLTQAIGPYLGALAKGELALLPVLGLTLLHEDRDLAQRVKDLMPTPSNEVSSLLPGNAVFTYLGNNGASAYVSIVTVKSKLNLASNTKLSNLTATDINPLFNELLVLGKTVGKLNRQLNLLGQVVAKLDTWYSQTDSTESQVVRHLKLENFLVSITQPTLKQFYLAAKLYVTILGILQKAKTRPEAAPSAQD